MIIKKHYLLIISFLILNFFFTFCTKNKKQSTDNQKSSFNIPYNLQKPYKKIKLSNKLREISALTYYNDSLLAAVQDEKATIYLINSNKGKIQQKIKIAGDGDFEGIEIVKDTAYMMESNGKILQVAHFNSSSPKVEQFDFAFSSKNDCEGLGYNPGTGELLIACKGKAALSGDVQQNENLPEMKKYRAVYAVKRSTMQLNNRPKYLLEKKAYEQLSKTGDFKPSAIAVHPLSKNIYILASAGKLLIVLDQNGNYLAHKQLKPDLFVQPEGICFSPDGKQLFISNEGTSKKATLLIFQ